MRCAIAPAALLLLLLPRVAAAHGFVEFVSTPVSPPKGFIWVSIAGLALLALGVCVMLRIIRGGTWAGSAVRALTAVTLFAAPFYCFGLLASGRTTAPSPGLGPPSRVYWGWGWSQSGSLFLGGNIHGLLFWLGSVAVVCRLWAPARRGKAMWILSIAGVLYALAIMPFVWRGAYLHGWPGGYVLDAEDTQISVLTEASFKYAKDHDGRFPVGQTIEDILPQISPYLHTQEFRYECPLHTPVTAWAFEKDPKPFIWSAQYSGAKLSSYQPGDPLFRSPYGHPDSVGRFAWNERETHMTRR